MAIEIIPTGGGTATAASISIPLTDLSGQGLLAAQMTNNAAGIAASLWAFMETVQAFDLSSVVGISKPAAKGFTSPGVGLVTETFSLTMQKVVDKVNSSVESIPVPTSGTNLGIGDFALTDIFPNAVKVAASGAVAAEAMLIPTADIAAYDASIVHATLDLDADSRSLLGALYHYLADTLTLRTTTVASAFTGRSIGAEVVVTLPDAYVAETNPTSDLVAADFTAGKKFLTSRSFSIAVQTIQQADNKYLVNSVVAS